MIRDRIKRLKMRRRPLLPRCRGRRRRGSLLRRPSCNVLIEKFKKIFVYPGAGVDNNNNLFYPGAAVAEHRGTQVKFIWIHEPWHSSNAVLGCGTGTCRSSQNCAAL